MSKCARLGLNVTEVNRLIQNHLIQAMEQAEDKLIELMRQEIEKTTHGQAPGKPSWRKEVSSLLRETYRLITSSYMEFEVGVPYEVAETLLIKAMIIHEGSGSVVGNPAIHAGPPGRPVWDGDLSGKKASSASSEYLLPAGFNQTGNKFVQNATRRMKAFFDEILDAACATLPSSIFFGNVTVS